MVSLRKKKILILGNHAVGLYNFRKELIESLIEIDCEVHFSVPNHEKVELISKIGAIYHEVELSRRSTNLIKDLLLTKYYFNLIRKIKPDVILTYTIKPNVYGGIAASIIGVPYISTITGLGSTFQKSGIFRKLVILLYRIGLRRAKAVFFQNEQNLQTFVDKGLINKGVTNKVPGSGVNLDMFTPIKENRNDDNIVKFLFIGRGMKEKGIEEYLEAAEYFSNRLDVKFQLLGFFEELEYKKRVDELQKLEVIEYLGESLDTRAEMSNVDCIVLPSYHEGMSNVLLEGAAMGLPLIATNIHGCKEAVGDGETGFLCESKSTESLIETLERFLRLSKDERIQMGLKGRKKMECEFDRQIIVNKYMETINQYIREIY